MAYRIKRQSKLVETLELCNADGTVAHVIEVNVNIDDIAGRVNKAWEMLGMAQVALQADPKSENAMETYGRAVLEVIRVIFGLENAETIVAFYDGRWTEMLLDLFPFINQIIMPRIKEASAARRAQLEALAK